MRVDTLALALRPRPMFEAADLGAALVRAYARSIWGCFLPVYGTLVLLALATVEISNWLPTLIIFMLKPWLDRTLLFTLSRAAFGHTTHWTDVWRARRVLWLGQLLPTLLARLSPWRSYIQPAHQLEGQHGRALRQRLRQLLHQRGGAACGLTFVFLHVEWVLCFALLSIGAWFAPQGKTRDVIQWLLENNETSQVMVSTLVWVLVIALLEPFYVAAGFCMYLNRRVELEAWDVEQALRASFAVARAKF